MAKERGQNNPEIKHVRTTTVIQKHVSYWINQVVFSSFLSLCFESTAGAEILKCFAGLCARDRPTLLLPRLVSVSRGEAKCYNWSEIWQYETKPNGQLFHSPTYESQGVSVHEKRYVKIILSHAVLVLFLCCNTRTAAFLGSKLFYNITANLNSSVNSC